MTPSFPHPVYAQHVLEPGFLHAQAWLWPYMIAANEAHTVMLAEAGIITTEHAASVLSAQRTVAADGPEAFSYDPQVEDLFFLLEARLIALAGSDAGGNVQIARSRNDLTPGMGRMFLRQRLLDIERLVLRLRARLIALIETQIDTLMPGITHTQPAQPTTLAHYLLGVLGPLERDSIRLRHAWERANQSPFGAAAFTTTGFPINRERTAELLGFDGFIENGYDAVGAADHLLEATQSLVTMVGGLGRFVNDLLIWARQEARTFRIGIEFVQISSIMPQKRNPVALEHIRTRIGYVFGDASSVATLVHGAAFGDTNDVEDPIYVPLARSFDAATAVLELLDATLETAEFDVELLASRVGDGFTTATALADGLVREYGLPFRTAHHITAKVVHPLIADGSTAMTSGSVERMALEVTGDALSIPDDWLTRQLDPREFVAARTVPGGPSRPAVERALASARAQLDLDSATVERANQQLENAVKLRAGRIDALLA
ncbi:MAG: argininosuccinate lyase [Thermomicrobiales bacterium]